ncbi:anthranilate synthase component I family protein [Phenylobacterium sp.]|jgi:para-aminobenzoate synthetase component 1|uniref:anthranilate synthase component I family protein n=1 Tax=Phenylobacterium sp. TaxID=1871053 RepID=UPI002E327842|nr:anthranilate synthase component I family protein [Phenylobacterium sp.]HEX2561534.1 anthranilate synthase component I family protein [Phenylobacterium sp.]
MRCTVLLDAPWREPLEALSAFADEPWAVGLVSGGAGPQARWSYLAREPDATLVVGPGDPIEPFEALRDLLGEPAPAAPEGPPFQGGLMGLAGYELGARVEPLALARKPGWPDLAAARYPAVLAFDHVDRRVVAVGRGEAPAEAEMRAQAAIGWFEAPRVAPYRGPLTSGLTASSGQGHEAVVADVVRRVQAGEIFQANVARSWTGGLRPGARPFDLLVRLASQSPAPFAAYLRLPGLAVVSNSPERFLRLQGRRAESRPIKGTRPRGRTPCEDAEFAAELIASAKDRAENLMIVDLMRNDLARVATPGSVRVPDLFAVESFANVHHLVSTVTAELAPGRAAPDLLRAAFPPGSVTGAPKVQAMKVIAAHELPRGPYCGSLFWMGFDGAMDSSVLIRTAALEETARGWAVEARAGGGVVADSEPGAERRETEAKIAALARALCGAGP